MGERALQGARFVKIEGRLDRHDSILERIDTRFDQVDARLDRMDTRFEQVDARLERLETKFDHGFNDLGTQLRHLGAQFEQMQTTVKFLAERMSDFARANADVRGRVDNLEEKQQVTDLRLRLLEKQG